MTQVNVARAQCGQDGREPHLSGVLVRQAGLPVRGDLVPGVQEVRLLPLECPVAHFAHYAVCADPFSLGPCGDGV